MSDTPRTDAAHLSSSGTAFRDLARELERERGTYLRQWEGTSQVLDQLRAYAELLRRELEDCCTRMDRCKGILRADRQAPEGWNVLDTKNARAALAKNPAKVDMSGEPFGDPHPLDCVHETNSLPPGIVRESTTDTTGTPVYLCVRCDCSFTYDPATHQCHQSCTKPECEAGRGLLEWVGAAGVEARLGLALQAGAARIAYLERELAARHQVNREDARDAARYRAIRAIAAVDVFDSAAKTCEWQITLPDDLADLHGHGIRNDFDAAVDMLVDSQSVAGKKP